MGRTSVASAIFDNAMALHDQHLAFLHNNIKMLNLGEIVFTAAEGTLFEGNYRKGSPDIVAVRAADPLEWYTVELKNGRNMDNTKIKRLDAQQRRVKAVLGRRGVLARSVKIYRVQDEEFAVFIGDSRYLEYSTPSSNNLEGMCAQKNMPAQRFFAAHPENLGIDSVLYSASNGRISNGERYLSIDLAFVNARNPAHWYVVEFKKDGEANVDDRLSRARRLLREHDIDATRIAVRQSANGYLVSKEREKPYLVPFPENGIYRLKMSEFSTSLKLVV